MKKLLNTLAAVSLLALSVSAFAQDKKMGEMKMKGGHMDEMKMHDMKMMGMVKGKPMGKMFMLSMKGKPTMKVDASKATFWMGGKMMKMGMLKDHANVTVMGHMMKGHIMASKVEMMPMKRMEPMMKKASANKMGMEKVKG